MLLGAIDIGSNAMRFLVASAVEFKGEWQFERVEYLRYPIRLGEDVFTTKKIGAQKIMKLVKMLRAYQAMFEVFEVNTFHACATSAMRDAENGKEIVEFIKNELGFEIEIIKGKKEAELTEKAIHRYLQKGNYIHIDVGGGSTEISFISDFKKLVSKSFNIGTVRTIHHGIPEKDWEDVKSWVEKNKVGELSAIGTGGNIKKLHELSEVVQDGAMSLNDLNSLLGRIKSMGIEDRMHKFKLNRDRADVIVPAGEIFSKIMAWAESDKIYAPNVGLIDGIAVDMWEKIMKE
ncbi:MAG: phosphatase [Cytophagales bacterium]